MVDDQTMGSRLPPADATPAPADSMPSGPGPDFGILLMLAARAFADDLHARLATEGFPSMRAGFGFMFRAIQDGSPPGGSRSRRAGCGFISRAIQDGSPTPSELAVRLGVSKQAVGKVLDEMEQRGFVERRPDPDDRRARRVRLTEHGRAAMLTA